MPFVTQRLSGAPGPVVAVSDYMRAVPDQIRAWVPSDYATLGADGFGLSDTRPAARRHFHIDGPVDRRPGAAVCWPRAARSTRPCRGDAADEVPAARRDGRHVRQRGRRRLTDPLR